MPILLALSSNALCAFFLRQRSPGAELDRRLVRMIDSAELRLELRSEVIDHRGVLLNPFEYLARVHIDAKELAEVRCYLRQRLPAEIHLQRERDGLLRLPHPGELAVVEELVSAVVASVELLSLAPTVPDDSVRSAPFTFAAPIQSLNCQLIATSNQ